MAGLGRAGFAAANALADRAGGEQVTVWDGWAGDRQKRRGDQLRKIGVTVDHGGDDLRLLGGKNPPAALIKSPGIQFDNPLIQAATQAGIPVLDEAELGWRLDHRPLIGVTGTNGKSTSVELTAAIFRAAGRSPVVAGNTTFGVPLSTAVEQPGDLVLAELSSFQLEGCPSLRADAALLTNFTHDHLYRHKTAARYEDLKRSLFLREDGACPVNAVGIDQEMGRRLTGDLRSAGSEVMTFGFHRGADRRVLAVLPSARGSRIEISEGATSRVLDVQLIGIHNALNAAGALAIADAMEIDSGLAAKAIEAVSPLPGRFERIEGPQGSEVFVDYAHNPDGVRQAIATARARLATKQRGSLRVVIAVFDIFGFDQAHAMGQIAAAGADQLILTTQPRDVEDPASELSPGLLDGALSASATEPRVVTDRAAAITAALTAAEPGDVTLVLGRGNLSGHPFDDRVEVRAAVTRIEA